MARERTVTTTQTWDIPVEELDTSNPIERTALAMWKAFKARDLRAYVEAGKELEDTPYSVSVWLDSVWITRQEAQS